MMDSMRYGETFGSITETSADRKYYDIPLRRPDGSPAKPASMPLMSFGVKLTLAFFIVWLLAYISAAFPYLGTYSYSNKDSSWTSTESFGLRSMILFEGQTAFIDYDLKAKKGPFAQAYVDIAPWPGLKGSSRQLHLNGNNNGTLSFIVPKTGVYTYRTRISLGEVVSYSSTWGAR